MSDEHTLEVSLVAADRLVWSGAATRVTARTVEGDIGILANHTPVLSLLRPTVVEISPEDGDVVRAAVSAGVLSVANNRVSVLSDRVTLAEDIDASEAQQELEEAQEAEKSADGEDKAAQESARERVRTAEARLRAAENG